MIRSGMREVASVMRDAGVLSLGSVGGAVLTFLVWVYLAHALPPEDYGALGAAFAFVALFQLFGDWGLNYLAIREGSKAPERSTALFRDLLGLKLLLLAAATVLCGAIALLLPFRSTERGLIFVYLATLPIMGVAGYVACLCNVHRRMARLSAAQVGERAAYAALVPPLVAFGLGPMGVILASVASAAAYVGAVLSATRPLRSGPLWPPSGRSSWRPHVFPALQFGVAAILSTVQQRIDVVLLALLADPIELSRYVAAMQVFLLLLLLAGAVAQAAFPWLVPRMHRREVSLRDLAIWTFVLAGAAIPFAAIASLSAAAFFPFLLGADLGQGAAVFRVLVWAFVPSLASIPAALALDALNLQRVHVANAAAMAGIAVVLNALWIPGLGAMGSAWAAVVAWSYGLFAAVPIAFFVLRRHARSGVRPSERNGKPL